MAAGSPPDPAHIEQFFDSLKPECVDWPTVPFERPPGTDAPIDTTERLGGLLRSYRRAA